MEWDFVEVVLSKLGFVEKWIKWIMESVRTVSYSLIINGKSTPRFYPTRGIRQRNSLSPYLFLFVVYVLSRMIHKRAQARVIEGLKLSRFCLELTHIFLIDDSLFFLKVNEGNCQKMVKCIQKYCRASGQKVNLEKLIKHSV